MKFTVAQCPRCGGDLRFHDVGDAAHCVYCGGTVLVERSSRIDDQISGVAGRRRRNLKEGAIQAAEGSELRGNWIGKPCNHPTVLAEYYREAKTGDYVCTTCGEAFPQIRVN